jgi:hypothetical protein
MNMVEIRREVSKVYPTSPTWPDKVKQMKDDQVRAIFLRFKREGKIR